MDGRKRSERNANRAPALRLLRQMWWWQRASACACSGRQIRHHLFMADLLAWLLIIAAFAFLFLKFR
jgi:hypothetical protein